MLQRKNSYGVFKINIIFIFFIYIIKYSKKYYHMIFSYVLITIPTIILTYIIATNLDKRINSLPMFVLYYLYFASTFNLIMAGTSDPGIFQRKYV
jgi:hypothetical protein